MTLSWAETTRQVVARAAERCEYCRMHQSLQGATFHIEHVVPSAAGGSDSLDNLSLACPGCNLKKSDRVSYRITLIPDFKAQVSIPPLNLLGNLRIRALTEKPRDSAA